MVSSTSTSPFDQMRVRFRDSIAYLDREKEGETRDVLMELYDNGSILNGIESFAEGGEKDGGMDNGMFSCFLAKKNAPPEESRTYRGPFWSDPKKKWYAERAFVACTKASIPLVMEGDAPVLSPMADIMRFASTKKVQYLGHVGKKSGRGPLMLDEDFTKSWDCCAVSDDQLRKTLNGGTFTIDNTEVGRIVHKVTALALATPLYFNSGEIALQYNSCKPFCGAAN